MFHFNEKTSQAVKDAINTAYTSKKRIRIFYGDTETGRSWHEENNVCGTIGRSTGTKKIPLLIANSRSLGGSGILEQCIVAVKIRNGFLYRHPNFQGGIWRVLPDGEKFAVYVDGEFHARFTTEKRAVRYSEFMRGNRLAK